MTNTEPATVGPIVAPVPLPAPLRILDADEYGRAIDAAREAGRRDGVGWKTAEEMAAAALVAAGLFPPPPDAEELEAECCTALSVAWEAEAVDPHSLGEWNQCGDEPGHDGDDHDNGEFAWSDGMPGTVPARTAEGG
ncbi:hypothetical protein [Streptomyces marianii]|uniref:Uncharacterized protein n=1 Tax=Streptomyces marianii TaxID=1817406 RepID=A0A5R9DR43_9ACTN|nr:hypothetical protein [Streptomyces marianii]TLQ38830.1 hypothetical protein FEF34_40155 [Streptomyces marianii]